MPGHYTTEDKSIALAALKLNEGNLTKTAREIGVPYSTLRDWRANQAEDRPHKKSEDAVEGLRLQLREVAQKILGKMQEEDRLNKAGIKDLAISFGIVMDKLEILSADERQDGQIIGLLDALRGERER